MQLPIDERGNPVFVENLLGYLLYLGWRDGVDIVVERGDILLPSVVEEALSEVEGELFAVVARHTYLSFDLLLRCAQLVVGQLCFVRE